MATKMESNENVVMTFYNPEVPKVKGKRTYQKPTLPTNKHPGASMPPQRRQQNVHQTHTYIRMFCGSLCGFSFLVAVCTSPLSWVQLLVIRDGAELYAGLWTLCSHELCWTHTPRPPYYLQFSRAASIISMLTTLTGLGWLLYSCLPGRGIVSNLDLKLSLLSFASGTELDRQGDTRLTQPSCLLAVVPRPVSGAGELALQGRHGARFLVDLPPELVGRLLVHVCWDHLFSQLHISHGSSL
ncbi:transmembrane protein 202 isoform X4 [Oryctolagus cuniculus]|uniref:transmembrane protein 202 isoform X4 n=1 Tax=Oryctolagus cuniculus TaxID=9986 RepID=UPI00387A629E